MFLNELRSKSICGTETARELLVCTLYLCYRNSLKVFRHKNGGTALKVCSVSMSMI